MDRVEFTGSFRRSFDSDGWDQCTSDQQEAIIEYAFLQAVSFEEIVKLVSHKESDYLQALEAAETSAYKVSSLVSNHDLLLDSARFAISFTAFVNVLNALGLKPPESIRAILKQFAPEASSD